MKKSKKIAIFFDTNIALHFQRLDQISWGKITQHKKIDIIVCSVVLTEIDKHKSEHPSKKIRHRASDYSAWLLGKFDNPALSDHVKIVFCPNEPQLNFSEHKLDPHIFDDRIIASVIEYAQINEDSEIRVITADLGLTLKLKVRDIAVSSLPDQYRLAEEADAEEILIKDLRSQLVKHTNRQPKINLKFSNNELFLPIDGGSFVTKARFIGDGLKTTKNEYPKFKKPIRADSSAFPFLETGKAFAELNDSLSGVSQSMRAEYDEELEVFYVAYEKYLSNIYEHDTREQARIELILSLSNIDGTAPASNIDIFIRCEEPFSFSRSKDMPDRPQAPQPPRKPASIFDLGSRFGFPQPNSIDYAGLLRPIEKPKLKISPGLAKFSIDGLKHRQQIELAPVWFDFQKIENFRNTSLSYEIHAPEIIDPIQGELHLRVD